MCVAVTSDLRKHLPPEEHLGNLSMLRSLPLGALPLPAPLAHLSRITELTSRWKRHGSGIGSAIWSQLLASLLPHSLLRAALSRLFRQLIHGRMPQIALTNMGPIDDALLDFGDGPCLEARLLPPIGQPPLLLAGVTGCAGALHFSVGYRHPSPTADQVKQLLGRMDRELELLRRL